MKLTVAGVAVDDVEEIWRSYARRRRTISTYDLGGVGDPNHLTKDEAWRSRIIASRLTHQDVPRLLARAESAPWRGVHADASMVDADPQVRAGLFDAAAALYWHFTTPRVPGIGVAKIHKVLHIKRPALYPVLDERLRRLYANQAERWVGRFPSADSGSSVTIWAAIREDLLAERNRDAFIAARRSLADQTETRSLCALSDVRLFDIVAWEVAGRAPH